LPVSLAIPVGSIVGSGQLISALGFFRYWTRSKARDKAMKDTNDSNVSVATEVLEVAEMPASANVAEMMTKDNVAEMPG
jgi:hypothetical protein